MNNDDQTILVNPDGARSSEAQAAQDADATQVMVADDRTQISTAGVQDDDATVVMRHEDVPDDPTALSVPARSDAPHELAPGAVVKDRFEIVSVLGRGGMGVVYRAIDRRKVEARDRDPHVALKALSQTWQRDERMVIALQREARKAQALAHPNIATVYDFDRDGDIVYITMEQLNGSPMDDFIRAHPQGLPRAQVIPILRGLCLALAYAHNKGIVHSDFKPGNVFLNEGKNPKVLDFGIARAVPVTGKIEASETTQFDAGELGALTPSYAAIEMFQGAPPHPADDVYALAITAYQLFTGKHPFNSLAAPQARSEGRKPEPIRGLKRREWQAIRRGLEFERSKRLGHAAEFLRVFEGPKTARLAIAASAALGLVLAGYFSFVQVRERARVTPDVPFEELAPEMQTSIAGHLKEGATAWQFGDVSSAIIAWRAAYVLHPRNAEATTKIIEGFEQMANSVLESGDPEGRRTLLANLDDLMATDGFLGTHQRLKVVKERLESP